MARPLLRDTLDTVRYCSMSSLGEVAGFSWSLDRLRAGEDDLSLSSDIWGDSLGGWSERSEWSELSSDTDSGVRILIGFSRILVGILFISFNVILVGDLELWMRDDVIL